MLNSIAIMVNSTLGAGAYRLPLAIATANVGPSFLSSGNHRYAFWSFCLVLTVLITLSDYPYSRQVLHGGVSLVVFPPSQIKRSVLSLQTQGSALQIRHRNHESLFWVQWARGCFFSERIRWRVSMGHDAMRTNVFFFHIRDVRVWDHYRCVCVVFLCHSQTDICSQGIRFRFMFPDLSSVPVLYSLPTVDSSSRSPRSASPAHYHCTATSTNPPSSPSSRSAGCLSPTCIPNPKR